MFLAKYAATRYMNKIKKCFMYNTKKSSIKSYEVDMARQISLKTPSYPEKSFL